MRIWKTGAIAAALLPMAIAQALAAGKDVTSAEVQYQAGSSPLANVEMYQDQINAKFGTDYKIPVVFYSQLMAVAFGLDPQKDAGLHRNTIAADKLEGMAGALAKMLSATWYRWQVRLV